MADEGGDGGAYGQDIVWVCSQCGRHHQKHSPPCSRCGNTNLEKQRPDFSDLEDLGGTSYLDVLEPKYAVGYLAVIGFAILVALSLTGVVSVPWLGGPSQPGAPGHADTYGNVSLHEVEDAYVDDLNELRAERGAESLSVDPALDDVATAFNRRQVRAGEDLNLSIVPRLVERYEPDCRREILFANRTALAHAVFDGTADPEAAATRLPIVPNETQTSELSGRFADVGVDVHVAPDDTVYATVFVC